MELYHVKLVKYKNTWIQVYLEAELKQSDAKVMVLFCW